MFTGDGPPQSPGWSVTGEIESAAHAQPGDLSHAQRVPALIDMTTSHTTYPHGPAFPDPRGSNQALGLTKQELFAAFALAGFCAHPEIGNQSPKVIASLASDQADELITYMNL